MSDEFVFLTEKEELGSYDGGVDRYERWGVVWDEATEDEQRRFRVAVHLYTKICRERGIGGVFDKEVAAFLGQEAYEEIEQRKVERRDQHDAPQCDYFQSLLHEDWDTLKWCRCGVDDMTRLFAEWKAGYMTAEIAKGLADKESSDKIDDDTSTIIG